MIIKSDKTSSFWKERKKYRYKKRELSFSHCTRLSSYKLTSGNLFHLLFSYLSRTRIKLSYFESIKFLYFLFSSSPFFPSLFFFLPLFSFFPSFSSIFLAFLSYDNPVSLVDRSLRDLSREKKFYVV